MKLVKLGAAILNQTPLDWDGNLANILAAINQAKQEGVSILCLPELCITGYGCEDDFFRPDMQRRAWQVLEEIEVQCEGIIVSVGLPVFYNNSLFNCAALIGDGSIRGLAAKKSLAGDGIHYEPRWFEAWAENVLVQADVYGRAIPLGDLYFDTGAVKIGFEICEEAWVGQRPGGLLSARGVDIILNPSASHFSFSKFQTRKRLVQEGSRAFGGTYVYANLLGNEAGRAIYDGGAIIAQSGELLALGERFIYADFALTSAVVDVELTRMRQSRTFSFQPEMSAQYNGRVQFSFDFPAMGPSVSTTGQRQAEWENGPHLKEEEFARAVALGLFDYLRKSGSQGYCVSLSGGADSTAVACLVWLMIGFSVEELGIEGFKEKLGHIKSLADLQSRSQLCQSLLACAYQGTRNSSDLTANAARAVASAIGAKFFQLDIDSLVDQYKLLAEKAMGRTLSWETDDLALQNIQARVRSPGIWFIANLLGSILLCTSNRSEGAVGYCTMDGDTSGGLSPVAGIDKAYLRQWLRWLERIGPKGLEPIPALVAVTEQAPTAELRPKSMAQTDEKDLMPYDLLDAIEAAGIEDNRSPLECYQLMYADPRFRPYGSQQLALWVEKFFRLWSINQWKRERLAPALHVASRNLDPRTWRRSPILSGGFKKEIGQMWAYLGKKGENSQKVGKALIRVDIQNDFMPGGKLAVKGGDEILPVVNELSRSEFFDLVIDTYDWHPVNHCSFEIFPAHCLEGSKGADFHKDLDLSRSKAKFEKGTDVEIDSLSGFGNPRLAPFLRERKVAEVYVVGLATDYCVRATALDALKAGFRTVVVEDGCRGVEAKSGDCKRAIDEMKNAGVLILCSEEILKNRAGAGLS